MSDDRERLRLFYEEWAKQFDLEAILREVVQMEDTPFVHVEFSNPPDDDQLSLSDPSEWGVEVESYIGTYCDPEIVNDAIRSNLEAAEAWGKVAEVCKAFSEHLEQPGMYVGSKPHQRPQSTSNREPDDG